MNTEVKELRSIVVLQSTSHKVGEDGFFHGWCKEPFFNDSGGYITKTYALVELSSGIVELIDPTLIKFKQPYEPKNYPTLI